MKYIFLILFILVCSHSFSQNTDKRISGYTRIKDKDFQLNDFKYFSDVKFADYIALYLNEVMTDIPGITDADIFYIAPNNKLIIYKNPLDPYTVSVSGIETSLSSYTNLKKKSEIKGIIMDSLFNKKMNSVAEIPDEFINEFIELNNKYALEKTRNKIYNILIDSAKHNYEIENDIIAIDYFEKALRIDSATFFSDSEIIYQYSYSIIYTSIKTINFNINEENVKKYLGTAIDLTKDNTDIVLKCKLYLLRGNLNYNLNNMGDAKKDFEEVIKNNCDDDNTKIAKDNLEIINAK